MTIYYLITENSFELVFGGSIGTVTSHWRKEANILRKFLKEIFSSTIGKSSAVMDLAKKIDSCVMGYEYGSTKALSASTPGKPAFPGQIDGLPFGVNVAGYLTGEFGLGEAGRADIRCLQKVGVPYAANNFAVSNHSSMDTSIRDFSKNNPYIFNLVHINMDKIDEFASAWGEPYFNGRHNIAYWVWELSSFPETYDGAFRRFNEIWTPSSFSMDAISMVSPVPVVRVPHAVEVDSSAMPNRIYFGLPEDKFVFLMVFDFYSLLGRKNPLGAVRAFRKAFEGEKGVVLVIKHINAKADLGQLSILEKELRGLQIVEFKNHMRKREVNSLMASCDCYVSLHRSEGFGLTIAEMMAIGKPVVATGYSGNMDFMNLNNSFPVRYKLIELEQDILPYKKGNIWAEPDEDHAAELMRLVFKNKKQRERISVEAAKTIEAEFSPEVVGKRYRERLLRIKNLKGF